MTADQVLGRAALADTTTPHPVTRSDKERISQSIPRRTISTRLRKILENPLEIISPIANRLINNLNCRRSRNKIHQPLW
ncbi:hypothetical protein LIER_39908 [Lithospermum erythrorhizon]|uniref:Uncharacterized protein n=1 Tax=Lithospermum erythrorhizon TaxID=34254 RepID=A0AAV3QPY1_LITER